jgi:hypothetical protein
MKIRKIHAIIALAALGIGAVIMRTIFRPPGVCRLPDNEKTVAERVEEFGPVVRERLGGRFQEIGVAYPPKRIVFLGLKSERVLEVWVAGADGRYVLLKTYPILGASGTLGPKLAEGDRQVPEGLYDIESLNPNSLFHLSLRIGYPNAFDRAKGKIEGRTDLGKDIMIHGSDASIGCLAMGDQAAEDLFVLAAETGIQNIKVILCPVDFRVRGLPSGKSRAPEWTSEIYEDIRRELSKLGGRKLQ